MPGADSGGAFGGVSNLKLMFGRARWGAGTGYVSFVAEKKSEVLQYMGLYSAVCCCSCAVLSFLAKLQPQLLVELHHQ